MSNYLFLDLSSKASGWAVSDDSGKLLDHGVIKASSQNVVKRIIVMRDTLKPIAEKYKITKVVAEEVRPDHTNSQTQKVLTWVQGVIIVMLFETNDKLEYEFIMPNSWRSKIGIHTGAGVKREALKAMDIKYVADKYSLNVGDDEADAIGIMDSYFVKQSGTHNWE